MIVKHFSIASSGDSNLLLVDHPHASNPNYIAGDFVTVKRMLVCNTDSTDITVNVWVKVGVDDFFIAKNVLVPVRTTIDLFDGEDFVYNITSKLYMNLGDAGYTADVTLNVY